MCRLDDHGLIPAGAGSIAAAGSAPPAPGGGPSSSTRARHSTTRPADARGQPCPSRAAPSILGICQRAGLPVVEDNPYGLLGLPRSCSASPRRGAIKLGAVTSR